MASGGVVSGASLINTGKLFINAGGTAIGTIVNSTDVGSPGSNGTLTINSGGVASGTVVNSSGIVNLNAGGAESGAG